MMSSESKSFDEISVIHAPGKQARSKKIHNRHERSDEYLDRKPLKFRGNHLSAIAKKGQCRCSSNSIQGFAMSSSFACVYCPSSLGSKKLLVNHYSAKHRGNNSNFPEKIDIL